MQNSTQHQAGMVSGLVPRAWARLFGSDAARLRERLQPAHWLSYVLIFAQSAAVLLVFGHAEIPLLASALWTVQAIAALGVFVLLASVLAADMAMLATIRRIPNLARNRQRWALREHVFYVAFVLITESITLGVVLATLDANPAALISNAPLIPPDGGWFRAQIVLRVLLVSWTAVQLVIVRGKLPVLLSTLTATGRELVGGHVEQKLSALDISTTDLAAAFRVYAGMSKPPRRVRTWWNGWLVAREMAQEAEESRQVQNVVDALADLDRGAAGSGGSNTRRTQAESGDPERPPTGPGSPIAAPAGGARRRRTGGGKAARRRQQSVIQLQPVPAEERAAAAWNAMPLRGDGKPRLSNTALMRAAGLSASSASKYARILAERDLQPRQQVAQ